MSPSSNRDALLTVTRSDDGPRVTVALTGELDLSNCKAVEAALTEACESGKQVLIDLTRLEFLDSTGLALIVATLGRRDAERFSFVPSRSSGVRRLLHLTGLDERMVLSSVSHSEQTTPVS
jgi:anti-anti-sigma factor